MTTSIQEIYENNLRRQYTDTDGKQFEEAEKQLASIRLDVKAQRNIDLLDEFFQRNRSLPVTVANIYRAVEERKNEFVWFSPAQFEFNKVAAENPAAAQQLVDWLAAQGKPGQLVNTGDQAYENLRLLLLTLRGYQIDSTRISHAIDRILHNPGQRLHYVPQPRREGPRSEAAKNDDGEPFLGRNLNEPAWVRRSRERSEQEAAERAKQPGAVAAAQSASVREAQRQAESIQGRTHAETDQLRKLFSTSGTEIDWVQTLAERQRMQKQFDKHRAVSRFIR